MNRSRIIGCIGSTFIDRLCLGAGNNTCLWHSQVYYQRAKENPAVVTRTTERQVQAQLAQADIGKYAKTNDLRHTEQLIVY